MSLLNTLPKAELLIDEDYKRELLGEIQKGIDKHERSAQVQVGPSEIGGCERKLVWKLAYGGDGADRQGGWAAHKGTVMHAWLDQEFKASERVMPDGTPRFWSDMKLVPVNPNVNGGTLDLYDRLMQRVVDWKVPGDGTMDKARAGTLSRGYMIQAMVYGHGLFMAGEPVQSVGLCFLPQCGDDLHKKAVFRYWKFNPEIARIAHANVDRYVNMLKIAPVARVLEIAPTMSDFCSSCPAYVGSGDRRAMCPGASVTNRTVDRNANPFAR